MPCPTPPPQATLRRRLNGFANHELFNAYRAFQLND